MDTKIVAASEFEAEGHAWARLGDDVLVWNAGTAQRGSSGLSVVTQVGASFQDEHPEVRVVMDRGRHLVIASDDVPPAGDGCWRAQSLTAGAVVVDRPETVAGRQDPATAALLDRLSQDAYEDALTLVLAPATRHSLSAEFDEVADAAARALTDLGYDVGSEAIEVDGGASRNVIAAQAGTADNPGLVLITAHLDSINLDGGPTAPAPGADDNGSGAAGVLELARVLATRRWRNDLQLILFGGEEEGLFGSGQHVAAMAAAERDRVRAVVNMDMIARTNTPEPGVLLEGAPVSKTLLDELAAAAATWTELAVSTSLNPFASDHVPFIDAGMNAVLTIEDNDSANHDVHTVGDVRAKLDTSLAMQILRMNLAVAAHHLDE